MGRPLLIIHHFYNESFPLMPFWCKHHRGMADKLILIDHHSTDNSVEICRDLLPEAEIRTTSLQKFGAVENDQEVMAIEREFPGWWKMALNTTEHIFHPDPRSWLNGLEQQHPEMPAFAIQTVVMCDPEDQWNSSLDFDKPLYEQRHFGYRDVGQFGEMERRPRNFHRADCGHYDIGRHRVHMQSLYLERLDDPFLLWWGFSPYPQVEGRKLQIQTRLPESDRGRFSFGHWDLTSEAFAQRVRDHAARAYDLWGQDWYVAALERMRKGMS